MLADLNFNAEIMLAYLFCEKGAAGVAASRGKKALSVDSDTRELALLTHDVKDFFRAKVGRSAFR